MKFCSEKSRHASRAPSNEPNCFGTRSNEPFFASSYGNVPSIQKKISESDSFKNNEKLMRIYAKIKQTEQYKFMIKGFEGEKSHLDLHLSVEKLNKENAKTSYKDDLVRIRFNETYIEKASDISIVRTFHHELQHAIKNLHLKRSNNRPSADDYPGIYDYYRRFVTEPKAAGKDRRDWHHNLMAAHSRPEIIRGMKQFDTDDKGIKKDRSGKVYVSALKKEVAYTDNEFYKAMSWAGLRLEHHEEGKPKIKTEAWKKFEKENPDKAFLYRAIIQKESNLYKKKTKTIPLDLPVIDVIGKRDSIPK